MLHSTALKDFLMAWVRLATLVYSIAVKVCHLSIDIIGQRDACHFTTMKLKEMLSILWIFFS